MGNTDQTQPILSINGKRGKRVDWETMDKVMTHPTAVITYTNSSTERDGKHENVTYCGRDYADGYRQWRIKARYAI